MFCGIFLQESLHKFDKEIDKIQSFIIPPKTGINYKPGIWHFPLISTEDTDIF